MRWLVIIALCLPVFGQSGPDAGANMACVERLEMPKYPWFARVAYIQGNVVAKITIGADGSVKAVNSPDAHPILVPPVEHALRASKFGSSCAGKSVTLVYDFAIDKDIKSDQAGQTVSFSFPNHFWITVPPAPPMID
jgi:hypothetical protein